MYPTKSLFQKEVKTVPVKKRLRELNRKTTAQAQKKSS